jgi:hypothetical protein
MGYFAKNNPSVDLRITKWNLFLQIVKMGKIVNFMHKKTVHSIIINLFIPKRKQVKLTYYLRKLN